MSMGNEPNANNRDRFIISKAHGAYALYAILADIGYLPTNDWLNFYNGSPLCGCVERDEKCGLEAGCGSLGHGLPIAVGLAWGAKLQKVPWRVFCLLGDGELQEGSNWEALQVAAKFQLDNLTVIVDGNRLQAMDFLHNILAYKNSDDEIMDKLIAFGADLIRCDGHDLAALITSFGNFTRQTFHVIYADTIKGYGLKAIENVPQFHFRIPNADEIAQGWRNGD
jgi:transketolase